MLSIAPESLAALAVLMFLVGFGAGGFVGYLRGVNAERRRLDRAGHKAAPDAIVEASDSHAVHRNGRGNVLYLRRNPEDGASVVRCDGDAEERGRLFLERYEATRPEVK